MGKDCISNLHWRALPVVFLCICAAGCETITDSVVGLFRENKPVDGPNTKNELTAINRSEQSSACPTSSRVYFFKISAAISVPPEEAPA